MLEQPVNEIIVHNAFNVSSTLKPYGYNGTV